MTDAKKLIFLVDDDITNLSIGSSVLSPIYDVITLNSGTRLLKVLEKKMPDLILLDVLMPELNGYETLKQIKAIDKFKNIPVIFLTAKTDADDKQIGMSLGAFDYIIKPFLPPVLLERIESCLKSQ